MLAALGLCALVGVQALGSESPRATVRHATAAIENDSVAVVAARWRVAANHRPADRFAVLGLATLARLQYAYPQADTLYRTLLPDSAGALDAIATYALLGQGLSARVRGAHRDAGSWFARAAAAPDPAAATEARILLAATYARTRGPRAPDSLLAAVAPVVTRDPQLGALYHCTRAELAALTASAGADDARRGAALAQQAGDRRLEAACDHALAADLGRKGGIWWSAAAFARAIEARRRLGDRAGLAASLQWRGFMLRSAGWFEDAGRDLAAAVAEGRASGNASAEAWAMANLALMALTVADVTAGAAYADSAAALFAAQGDRYGASLVEGTRGGIAMAAGNYARAREVYRGTAARAEELQDAAALVVTRTYLAHLAMRTHDWEAAAREFGAARKAAKSAGMIARLNALDYHEGSLALRTGRLAEARRLFQAGLARVEDDEGQQQFDWQYYYRLRLAELFARQGDLRRAESLAVAGMNAADAWRASLSQRELRLQAFQVAEDQSDPDLGLATIINQLAASGAHRETAFALAERLRGRDLLERLARADALAAADSVRDRRAATPAFARAATRTEIAAALPDERTALLEFVTGRGGEPSTVVVLTRQDLRAYTLPPVDSVERLIDRWNSLLEAGTEPRELASTLGAALLADAVAGMPPSVTTLVIVPDGALHRVPFDALVMPDGRYMVEAYAIGITPSATVATRLWNARGTPQPGPVLAFADALPPTAPRASELPPLRASRREARLVARYAAGSTVRLGRHATETWLKHAELQQYRVLHFATHARADEATLAGSAIAVSPGGGEDGLVGPGELGRLKLNADLVVLSSCRSGAGVVVRGEGIVGLAAPLLEAGARTIALTRWSIGDRETVPLIAAFYAGLARGEPAAQALRSAKLDAIARGARATTWAAFTIIGDPTVLVPLSAPGPAMSWVWLLVGVLAAALLAAWIRRRRVFRAAPTVA